MHSTIWICLRFAAALSILGAISEGSGALTAPPGLQGQIQFVEVAGEMEFSGRLIARPIQVDDWVESGLNRRASQRRAVEAAALLQQFELYRYVPQTDETIILVPGGRSENELSGELMGSGLFEYVEPDWILFPLGCPDDSLFGNQWQHAANIMQSCDGWDIHTGDPSTSVGICDTGLRLTHEDIQLHRLEGYNAVDFLWESQGGNLSDINGHGTATTGCAAANGNNGVGIAGVGWNLSHRILRVSNQSSGNSSSSTLTHAARTAVEAGDRVASVSYSGVTASSVRTTGTYIKSIDGLLVWAAGNSNANLTSNDRDDDDVIVVGATDDNDDKASFSNYGVYVDLCAPGVSVYTMSNAGNASYGGASGTSFSCPLTAGLVALIWSANPGLTPDEVELILKQGCDDIGNPGIDNIHGYGRINVFNSLVISAINLDFNYPNGLPSLINPAGGTTVRVEVLADGATPQPGTGVLHVNDGSGWLEVPMDEISDNVYDAMFPAVECGNIVQFYFTAETTDGDVVADPSGAPTASAYAAPAATGLTVAFQDNFEANMGWTVVNENLTDGAWQRGVPTGDGSRGDPTDDFDNSGSCFLTDNTAGNSDVDGGPTRLISPVFDLSGSGDARISYARWFYNDDGDVDRLTVEISNNGGASWTLVESVADNDTGGWIEHAFNVSDFVAPTSDMRLRFSATDNPNDSVTEAALDAVRAEIITCGGETSLVDFQLTRGIHLSGGLPELLDSDNLFYSARSVPGFTANQPNIAEIETQHLTTIGSPLSVDVRVESRLNQSGGTQRVWLKNYSTGGNFELLRTYAIGSTEHVEAFTVGPEFVNSADDRVWTRVRTSVLVTFTAQGFQKHIDQILVDVN